MFFLAPAFALTVGQKSPATTSFPRSARLSLLSTFDRTPQGEGNVFDGPITDLVGGGMGEVEGAGGLTKDAGGDVVVLSPSVR